MLAVSWSICRQPARRDDQSASGARGGVSQARAVLSGPGGAMVEDHMNESFMISSQEKTDEENVAMENVTNSRKFVEVKCGSLVAKMHVELFLCPGIHQPCIEFENEMISPKEFTVRANKDKQKDWKGSIRIGRSNLRSLMEMHSFDFFNHTYFCSAKCQSRNYITPKERDADKMRRKSNLQAEKAAAQISQLFNSRLIGLSDCTLDACTVSHLVKLNNGVIKNTNNNNNTVNNKNSSDSSDKNSGISSTISSSTLSMKGNDCAEDFIDVDDSLTDVQNVDTPTTEQILRLMNTEPISFWNEMNRFGLLDEMVDQLSECLSNVKQAAKSGGLVWAAPALTRIVSVLNMGDRIVSSIHSKPSGEIHSTVNAKPRLSTDHSSVEDYARKRSINESVQSSQSRHSPDVKRPRVQYPANVTNAACALVCFVAISKKC
ncbi:unnamed protein product [Angiostrongylus costaricensis]|uniref:SAND domain-containing protein n=1 Tax=Angiostrongylus costaricensis TaxID=334426 RepID=A0A158PKU3_ANGCS|nr:unnamed protein product [Angiostrongylus costaricensis]